MTKNTDDSWAPGVKYTWTKESQFSLEDFLSKYRPSMVQDDGTKPWIWVKGSHPNSSKKGDTDQVKAEEEAALLLQEISDRVKGIQDDPSIPTRSNKKTGARSKKELREEVQAEATDKLKEIAVRHGYVQGKWLIFAPPDRVDMIWSQVATSLVSGPLSSTVASLAKVATTPEHETPNYQHIICVYIPDVFDKPAVLEVMKVLLRNHGATLSGVKADLYTMIGIDSKHPSGIPSTIWKNTSLLKDTEIKGLKEEYFANLNKNPDTISAPPQGGYKEPSSSNQADNDTLKTKPKIKSNLKKRVRDDFFASDDEEKEEEEEKRRKDVLKAKKAVGKPKKVKPSSDEESDEGEQGNLKPKRARISRK